MGFDCTLHVIDPARLRDVFCARLLGENTPLSAFESQKGANAIWAQISAALQADDAVVAARLIAQGAICFMSAELPAHYERGFCLSLWSWRMEDDALIAEVPPQHRGPAADLDILFAPLVEAHPRLKGRWPTELTGNGSTGVFVPREKISGLLKWTKNRVSKYPRAARRIFRGLLLVLEECERRGMAYWEASDLTAIDHPIVVPEHLRTAWLEEVRLPRKGTWDMIANVAMPGQSPLCVFNFLGLENFLTEQPAVAIADLTTWPPLWTMRDESIEHCDRGRDGRWVIVGRRERDRGGLFRSAPRILESREEIGASGAVIDVPMTEGAQGLLQGYNGPAGPSPDATPVVDFVGIIGEVPVITVGTGPMGEQVPPYRPYAIKGKHSAEIEELQATSIPYALRSIVRLPDGGEVLIWQNKGYELVNGRFTQTFSFTPANFSIHNCDGIASAGTDAILAQAYATTSNSSGEREGALFLFRRNQEPRQVAPAVEHLAYFSPGPNGSVVARQVGPNPKHFGCLLWPEENERGVLIWLDDDLFPDEDPENIDALLWSQSAGRLIGVTSERLWAIPIERVLRLPRYDATTGRKLRVAKTD